MKKIYFTLIASVLIVLSVSAQKTIYGHINGDKTFNKMPEVIKASEDLKKYISTYEEYAKKLQDEYAAKLEDFNKNKESMSELIRKSEVESINGLNDKIQKYATSAQEDINKKRTELFLPSIEKFNAAVKKVAVQKGLRGIIDSGKGVFLYFDPADDVTKYVEEELGIK